MGIIAHVIFAYPFQLEAYRSDRWQGVTPSPTKYEGYGGSAFYGYMSIDTDRNVEPVTASTAESSGANTTVLIIVGVVAAVIVIGLIVWLTMRRRGRTVEE